MYYQNWPLKGSETMQYVIGFAISTASSIRGGSLKMTPPMETVVLLYMMCEGHWWPWLNMVCLSLLHTISSISLMELHVCIYTNAYTILSYAGIYLLWHHKDPQDKLVFWPWNLRELELLNSAHNWNITANFLNGGNLLMRLTPIALCQQDVSLDGCITEVKLALSRR